ncbi:MAG: hypothetical protein V4697_03475 [Patescibacteria group bacterium]
MKSPSIKNSALILIAALLVGGAFLIAEYQNKNAEAIYKDSLTASNEAGDATAQERDTDGDGLKDWEEVLLGTDQNDGDTDGDGTSDGKEVEAKRNPLVAGPKDSLAASAAVDLTKQKEILDPLDALSREFFAKYMELSKLGISKDPLNRQELIDNAVGSIPFEKPTTYTTATILVKADNSTLSIKNYGNEVGDAFKKNVNPDTRNEGVIAKEALEKQDPSILKEIDPIITSYKKILTALRAIQAPQAVATLHVELVNGMSAGLFAAQSLRDSGDDPVKALQGAGSYQDAERQLRNSLVNIRGYMTFLGITYTENESGYLLFPHNEE